MMCTHQPPCPPAEAAACRNARVVADQPAQGWQLLCNGVIRFDDGGALLPAGSEAGSTPVARRALAVA